MEPDIQFWGIVAGSGIGRRIALSALLLAGALAPAVLLSAVPAAFAAPTYSYETDFLGVCYSPTHYSAADNANPQTTLDAFGKDFPLISAKGFKVVRSYWLSSEAHYLNFVGQASRNKLKTIIEVPVNPNFPADNQAVLDQFNSFLLFVKKTPESRRGQVMKTVVFDNYSYRNVDYVTPSMFAETVILVLAGNENIPAASTESASLIALKDSIQQILNANGFGAVAVSYCLEADVWSGDPSVYPNRQKLLESLAPGVPFLMTCYPFEWGMPVGSSVQGGAHSLESYVNRVSGYYPDLVKKHPIIFGETGWATAGTASGSSPANLDNAAGYLSRVYSWFPAQAKSVRGIMIFEAFDEVTKTGPEYQRHYGLWTGGSPAQPGVWKQGLPAPAGKQLIVSARDYDGDGISEHAVYRDSSGLWVVRGVTRAHFGRTGDLPVSGDYTGVGTTEFAVFRPSSGFWAVRGLTRFYFGASGDIAAPGDYDGTGTVRAGIFRKSSGLWAIRGVTRAYFGKAADLPVPGNYTGEGIESIGIFRPDTGLWAIRGVTRAYFGRFGDLPVPGDYTGDGTWGLAVYRPAAGLWAVRGITRVYFGVSTDTPLPVDCLGDGTEHIGIFRPDLGLWAIRGVTRVHWGKSGDVPVSR